MSKRSTKLLLCIMLLASNLLFAASNSTNSDINARNADLNKLSAQIEQLKKSLDQAKIKQQQLSKNLNVNSQAIEEAHQHLVELNSQLQKKTQQLAALKQKQTQRQQNMDEQYSQLTTELRALYLINRPHYLQVLLNQQDTSSWSRYHTYYNYLSQARLALLERLNQDLTQLQDLQQKAVQQTQTLQTLRIKTQQKNRQLETSQLAQQQNLANINNNIQHNSQKLKELLTNKQALENVIKKLRQTSTNFYVPANSSFGKLQGRLNWPIVGSIAVHFGTPIDQSGLTYSGVLLRTNSQQEVYSIYNGRVVFADWLKGFGLLTIVDHGGGFMTLYGQNRALYQKVGSTVKAGDLIASTNASNDPQSGLYFEIRYNGKPINPELWCSNKASTK